MSSAVDLDDPPGETRRPPETARRPAATGSARSLRGIGQTLITFGLVALLFVVYELWVTDLFAAQDQNQLSEEIHEQWARHAHGRRRSSRRRPQPAPSFTPAPIDVGVGDPFAVLHIPRLRRRRLLAGRRRGRRADPARPGAGPLHRHGDARRAGQRSRSPGTASGAARRSSTWTSCGPATRSSSRPPTPGSSTACSATRRPATSAPTPAGSRAGRSSRRPRSRSSRPRRADRDGPGQRRVPDADHLPPEVLGPAAADHPRAAGRRTAEQGRRRRTVPPALTG